MLTALALSRDPSLTEGLKEIRADILIGKLKTREEVEEAIRRAVQSGKLSREALDKFLSESGQLKFTRKWLNPHSMMKLAFNFRLLGERVGQVPADRGRAGAERGHGKQDHIGTRECLPARRHS